MKLLVREQLKEFGCSLSRDVEKPGGDEGMGGNEERLLFQSLNEIDEQALGQ